MLSVLLELRVMAGQGLARVWIENLEQDTGELQEPAQTETHVSDGPRHQRKHRPDVFTLLQ